MFSFFKKDVAASSTSNVAKERQQDHLDADEEESQSNISNIELSVELGGGKGWPTDVTCVLYHKIQGLICVGTEGGAIYVYGDGFQFMRPWLTNDPNEVTSLVSLHHDKIMVSFNDNSIVVMDLPSLDVVDLLSPSWLDRNRHGDISVVHVDVPGEKNFAYIGTTEGAVFVLDIMETSIRICDFKLNCDDLGLSHGMAVSDIQSCPKDDRYLAIGFSGSSASVGSIVVYDLMKSKVHKSFKTAAITCMDWMCSGESLFAGTMRGELLTTGLDRAAAVSVWSAVSELADEGDGDDDDEDSEAAVVIRRVTWLAPQANCTEGCLFVSLASRGSDDDLKSVLVGLSPLGVHGELDVVFSLPPIPYEHLLGFKLVPTYDKEECGGPEKGGITPGLLLLTERQRDGASAVKQLKIVRCPSVPVTDWALEIGTTPDPRKACEVLPSTSEVTAMSGFLPNGSTSSLSAALLANSSEGKLGAVAAPAALQTTVDDHDHEVLPQRTPSRRLSTRDFMTANNLISDLEQQLGDADRWEMVLASGVHQQPSASAPRLQDIVLKGHADGTVIAWGVSLPVSGQELGRGNIWLPLKALRCGSSEVRCLFADEDSGLLAAGDESGLVVVWETCDSRSGRSASDILQHILEDVEENGEDSLDRASFYADFSPDSLKEVLRVNLSDAVSSLLLLPSTLSLFIGTEDGNVHACANIHRSKGQTLKPLDRVDRNTGAVLKLHFGFFSIFGAQIPSVYAYFAGGQLSVIEHNSRSCLAFYSGSAAGVDDESVGSIGAMVVLNASYAPLDAPSLLSVTQAISAAAAAATSASRSKAVEQNSDSSLPPAKPARMSLFAAKPKAVPPPAPAQPISESVVPPAEDPVDDKSAPRYLVLVRGKLLVTYDLVKLAAKQGSSGSMFKSSSQVGYAGSDVVTTKSVAQEPVVTSHLLLYADCNGDEDDERLPCLGCLSSNGLFVLVSLKNRAPVSHSSLLEGVLEADSTSEERLVSLGTVLDNGNCYFLNGARTMVYSAAAHSDTRVLLQRLPDRASPKSTPPAKELWLKHGRESQLAQLKATLKKRRSSVINMSAAPTDLYKIFAKSREQRGKDALLEDSSREVDEQRASAARTANKSAGKAIADMNQVKASFEERSHRINQIALKMDDFKESAHQYRQNVAEQKEKLQKKNGRWGLF